MRIRPGPISTIHCDVIDFEKAGRRIRAWDGDSHTTPTTRLNTAFPNCDNIWDVPLQSIMDCITRLIDARYPLRRGIRFSGCKRNRRAEDGLAQGLVSGEGHARICDRNQSAAERSFVTIRQKVLGPKTNRDVENRIPDEIKWNRSEPAIAQVAGLEIIPASSKASERKFPIRIGDGKAGDVNKHYSARRDRHARGIIDHSAPDQRSVAVARAIAPTRFWSTLRIKGGRDDERRHQGGEGQPAKASGHRAAA
jgi:hypothetical protein